MFGDKGLKGFETIAKYGMDKEALGKVFTPGELRSYLEKAESIGTSTALAWRLLAGDLSGAISLIGEKGARRLFTEFIINPAAHNLMRSFGKAVNQNKPALMLAISKKMGDLFEKTLPDALESDFEGERSFDLD